MKKSLVYIASLSVAAMAAPLTLQEALEMAKSNNSQIKAEKAKEWTGTCHPIWVPGSPSRP